MKIDDESDAKRQVGSQPNSTSASSKGPQSQPAGKPLKVERDGYAVHDYGAGEHPITDRIERQADATLGSDSHSPLGLVDFSQKSDFGDYELITEVARGGMGVVFKARQKRLNRIVALKVILAGEYARPAELERFQAEAEAAAKLQHSAIVPIYEVGECEGRPYFSMGFINGTTLAKTIEQGPLTGKAAARLMVKICDAISYAHEHGIVHRDIKPGNILIDQLGGLFVTDFGLAKRTDVNSNLTGTGQILGTPTYMAPEQAAANNDSIGPLSDVYSLGAVLYCLLTGHPPFRAANVMDTLLQVIYQEPMPPRQLNPSVDRDLQTICLKCLEKEPARRYQSAAELNADLGRFLDMEPIRARPSGIATRVWRRCRRNPVVSLLGAMLIALFLTLALLGPPIAVRQANLRAQADRLVNEKESLIGDLTGAMQRSLSLQQRAETSATALHQHLVDMYVERGNSEIDRGHPASALPWYALALEMDEGNQAHEWGHRIRLASIIDQAPRTHWIWQLAEEATESTLSPDGQLVAAGSRSGEVSVWHADNGNRIFNRTSSQNSTVKNLEFTSDSRRLLIATTSQIQIWDLGTQEPAAPPIDCTSSFRSVDLDRDGNLVGVGLNDGRVLLFDAETGKLLREFDQHDRRVNKVAVRSDVNRLLSCGDDHTAHLCDLQTGETIAQLSHSEPVVWAEFDPTGTRIVTASDDGLVKLWSAATGDALTAPLVHPDRVRVATFDASGTRVATGAYDTAARIWDVATGKLLAGPMYRENSIPRIDFSDDGHYLITASLDHTATIWDASSGKQVCPPLRHGFLVANAMFFPKGYRVLTASADQMVRVWAFSPLANQKVLVRHQAAVSSCRLSPNGKLLLTASTDGTARVWDADSGESNLELRHEAEVIVADFSSDGKYIVTASTDGTARVWSAADGRPVTPALQHDSQVWHAAFSPDNSLVLTTSQDRTARIWNARDGSLKHILRHRRSISHGAFDRTGAQVLTCSDDNTSRVWDVQTGVAISPPLAHDYRVEGGAFSADGKRVVTSSLDHTAQVWNIASGEKTIPSIKHHAGIQNVSFTPDGTQILTGSRDGSARLWNASDGSPMTPPMSIGHGLVRAAVSPCGRFIATGGGDSALLWDARSGRPLGAQMQHDNWVVDLRFSADSKYLATASDDGTARIWRLPDAGERTNEDLQRQARLISGHRADPVNGLTPLSPAELQSALTAAPSTTPPVPAQSQPPQ